MNLRKNLFRIYGAKFYKHFVLSAFLLTGLAVSVNAQTTLSQSSSNTVTAGNTIECTNQSTGFTLQNSLWRAYDLSSLGSSGNFNVTSVTFGIDVANAAGTGTTQPVTVNLYTNTGAAFPGGTRTLVGTATAAIPDQTSTLYTVPVTAAVPIAAGTRLVLEVNIPDGTTAGNAFFLGSNTAAETGPSYLSAPSCGVTTPTTYAAIGFPNVHIVLNVTGTVAGTTAASVTVGGRVLRANGRGIGNARVTITNLNGESLTATTNPFGYYQFTDIPSGETYFLRVSAKLYRFTQSSQVHSILEETGDINFVADN